MSEVVSLMLGFLLLAAVNVGAWWWFARLMREKEESQEQGSEGLNLVLQQMNELTKTVDSKIGETSKQMHETVRNQFHDSQRLINEVKDQVHQQLLDVSKGQTEMKERSNQIFTIAEQLQDLQRTLKSQKERGNFGEASLELILSNILPPETYQMQYRFNDDSIVDAVVIDNNHGVIPIDAKFSLESYNQLVNAGEDEDDEQLQRKFKDDLKKRIDETAKYIKPKEGTVPFAFMFIPAEGIYYDLLVNRVGSSGVNSRSLIDYAMNEKKVIIVSPTTFYAYLQSVLYGFNAYKIEKSAEHIKKNVGKLQTHFSAYNDYMQRLGNTLGTTVNHYNKATKELGKISKDMTKITDERFELENPEPERPVSLEEAKQEA